MRNISRAGGAGLLVFGVGSLVGFFGSGAPGGDYRDARIAAFIAPGHYATGILLTAVGVLASIGLLAFGQALRALGPGSGELAWGLTVAAVAAAVVGGFIIAGIEFGMLEGGAPVQTGVPHPVVYAISEIGNLVSVCAPALLVGVAAIMLAARSRLPMWARGFSLVAGACGVLAPLFVTYFVFALWTVVVGGWAVVTGEGSLQPEPLARVAA